MRAADSVGWASALSPDPQGVGGGVADDHGHAGLVRRAALLPEETWPWLRPARHTRCGMPSPEIRASRGAARYVRKRGGVIYVWRSESGLLDYATTKPVNDIQFRRLSGPGFALHLDKRALLGKWVHVARSPLPPWRLQIGFEHQGHGDGSSGGSGGW